MLVGWLRHHPFAMFTVFNLRRPTRHAEGYYTKDELSMRREEVYRCAGSFGRCAVAEVSEPFHFVQDFLSVSTRTAGNCVGINLLLLVLRERVGVRVILTNGDLFPRSHTHPNLLPVYREKGPNPRFHTRLP
jgi:hypothetical protein